MLHGAFGLVIPRIRPVLVIGLLSELAFVPPGPAATVTLAAPQARLPGCEAHVVDASAIEQIAPCGTPIRISSGRAFGWIESPTSITPYLTLVAEGEVSIPGLVPSGSITFPRDRQLLRGERIRLFSLASPESGGALRRLFVRDVISIQQKPRMPAGGAIAVLIDEKGRAVGASRPVTIRAGAETEVWPDGKTSALIAWLARPRNIEHHEQDRVAITAADETGDHAPKAMVNAADSVLAIWYDLSGPEASLTVDSQALRVAQNRVEIVRGSVTMTEEKLRLLPSLAVAIASLPRDAEQIASPISLTISPLNDKTRKVRTISVQPGKTYTVEGLPAALLVLDLRVGDFLLQKRVDLTSGDDATTSIALNPLVISGTVYVGEVPTKAQIRFLQDGAPFVVETNAAGSYEAILWQPRRYIVETVLADRPAMPPFSEDVSITASRTFDIHVPDTSLRVRVYDADNGKSITHGRVIVQNRWTDESGSSSRLASVELTGELTDLPPLRPGTAEIRIHVDGYSAVGPISLPIDANIRGRVIDVPMTREADGVQVDIRLNEATPAAGAEVVAFSGDELLWRGTTDDSGRVTIPKAIAERRVVVRHPSAASDVAIFGPSPATNAMLLEPAAPPLVVRVVHRDQSPVGPAAARMTILRGARLSGAELGFLTWSLGVTSPDGTFIAKGLPRRPLRLLATRSASPTQIRSGSFDSLGTAIPYPWPAVAVVVLADE